MAQSTSAITKQSLKEQYPCEMCKGTGRDEAASRGLSSGVVYCTNCRGNCWDPAAVFYGHRAQMDAWWINVGSKPSPDAPKERDEK